MSIALTAAQKTVKKHRERIDEVGALVASRSSRPASTSADREEKRRKLIARPSVAPR